MVQSPRPAIRRHRRVRLTDAVLVVAFLAFGFGSVLQLCRPVAAHADEISDLMTEPSDQAQDSDQAMPSDVETPINPGVAQDANQPDETDPCLAPLPIPTPAAGLHRVIQMVNCSNQTILGSADAAGRAPSPPVPVFPREKTWIMGPVGSPNRPDGSPGNVLTIDIPLVWESTGPVKSTGPLFWGLI